MLNQSSDVREFKFFLLVFRLTPDNYERLEIGSGTLEMGLNMDLEDRIAFWSEIWNVKSD
jgi:hypothetical protein